MTEPSTYDQLETARVPLVTRPGNWPLAQ